VLIESNNPIYNRRKVSEPMPRDEKNHEEDCSTDEECELRGSREGLGINLARVAASFVKKKTLAESSGRARGTYREPESSQEETESSESYSSEEEVEQKSVRKTRTGGKHTITATEMGMFNEIKLDAKDEKLPKNSGAGEKAQHL